LLRGLQLAYFYSIQIEYSRNTPKPPEMTVSKADEMQVGVQDEVLQTPVMPVTAEALTSLYKLIKQDSSALDKQSKQRMKKFPNAAHMFCANRALLKDECRFMLEINNEAKGCRLTQSEVAGKAKVMSYEDIVEAREKRATKKIKVKGKRGRKWKTAMLEEDDNEVEVEPEPKVARIETPESDVTLVTRNPQPEPEVVQMTWRAPIAQMI
jgi:hypothetical protein